jgi:DNA-binding GntR family transcriptional regulator
MRDQIYALLRADILTGRLRPGQAIEEKAIATRLGVSRTPVHEAVKKLADEHLVEVRAQSGTMVSLLDRARIEEAHVIRRALEIESAGLAAGRAGPAALNRLDDLLMLHGATIERHDYAEAILLDDAFHRAVSDISGLAMLWRVIEISKAQLDRCRHLMLPREGGAATLAEHRAIIAALATGASDVARRAMQAHLDRAFRDTLRGLDLIFDPTHPKADQT